MISPTRGSAPSGISAGAAEASVCPGPSRMPRSMAAPARAATTVLETDFTFTGRSGPGPRKARA